MNRPVTQNRPPPPECTPDNVAAWLAERAEELERRAKSERTMDPALNMRRQARELRSLIDAFRHHFGYDP